MKTIHYKLGYYKIVDNEHDYDFVGYIENFTSSPLIVLFKPGEFDYDEYDEVVWDEDDWTVDQIVFGGNEAAVEKFEEYAEENEMEVVVISPNDWGGFEADNRGRSMFNALKKAFAKNNK